MGHLKLYDVTQNGRTTRLRLNEADAKLYGAAAVAYAPPRVHEVGDADDAEDRAKRAAEPANKARLAGGNKAG